MAKKGRRQRRKVAAPAAPIDRRCLKFSLEYLDLDNPKFDIEECEAGFFIALFNEICRYQTFTVDQFKEPSPSEHRHSIYFPETTETDGFEGIDPSEDEGLWTEDHWQFGLRNGNGNYSPCPWRVHGFVDGDHFHIVWFDPCHRLDPTGNHGANSN